MPARRPQRPFRRSAIAAAVLAVLAIAGPGGVLAASVAELVKLAEGGYSMSCAANGTNTAQVCVHRVTPWRAVIRPASGPETQLVTESPDSTPPLDTSAQAWMADMHETACGDSKGVSAFVQAVAQMTQFSKLREIKDTIGTCDFVGGLYGGAAAPLTYRVTSAVRPPAPTPPPPRPTPTPAATAAPTATPKSSIGPTATRGAVASATPDASHVPSGSPSGSAGTSMSALPTAAATDGPSPVVGGVETGPPAPGPTDAIAAPGEVAPTPEPTTPTFEQSVAGITDVSTETGAIGGSLLLALLLLLIVGFAGELFNNTIENNYSTIAGWLGRRPLRWLQELGGRFRGDATIGLVGFLALTALISSFVDPAFGFNLRSLGVYLGFLVGLAIVLATFKLPPMLAHRRETGDMGRLRPLPWALVIAALFVLVSRIGGLQPGYLYGIVLGVLFVKEVSPKEEGRHTFFGSLWTLGAAVLGWLGLTWLRGLGLDPDGFLATLATTASAAVMVAGLEATAFGLMPLRFMPGYAVYRWNRLAWALLWGLSLFGFLHILIAPVSGYVSQLSPQAFTAALGVFAAFGALSIAVWGYFRFQRPAAPLEARFD